MADVAERAHLARDARVQLQIFAGDDADVKRTPRFITPISGFNACYCRHLIVFNWKGLKESDQLKQPRRPAQYF